jgi:hypothetical protein
MEGNSTHPRTCPNRSRDGTQENESADDGMDGVTGRSGTDEVFCMQTKGQTI